MKNDKTRVLGRIGAKELSKEELEQVAGAGTEHTNVITFIPPATRDGDG